MKDERVVKTATLLRHCLRQSPLVWSYDHVSRVWTYENNKTSGWRALVKAFKEHLGHSQHLFDASVQQEVKEMIERGY